MSESYVPGFKDLVSIADDIRQRVDASSIIGFAAFEGLSRDSIDFETLDESWRPFVGLKMLNGTAILMVASSDDGTSQDRTAGIRILKQMDGAFLLTVGRCTTLHARIPENGLALIADHINLTGSNPLSGPNDDEIGPRFSSMTEPYRLRFLKLAEELALAEGLTAHRCVFAGIAASPTAAECRYLAYTGADVYGFGITSDTIVANHTDLAVIALADVIASRIPEGPVSRGSMPLDATRLSDSLSVMVERILAS